MMKAFGVLVVATLATLALAVVGVVAALLVVGDTDGQLVTLSGTTVGIKEALSTGGRSPSAAPLTRPVGSRTRTRRWPRRSQSRSTRPAEQRYSATAAPA
jgi:hypothetical protein